jgi:glycosyltransferase involved in cell wall biosynthesis
MLKVLQIGAKNYPPAHGGTERVVYNIVNSIDSVDFYLLVEWNQEETNRIFVLPENLNYFSKMMFIVNFVKKHNIDIIHFHNEKYIPMAILLSISFRKIVLTVHGVHFRSPKFTWYNRIIFWIADVLGYLFLPRMIFCSECDQKEFSKYFFFRKSYFINNGTDLSEKVQMDSDIEFPDTLIYLGRITPAKNIHNLVDAATSKKIKVHIYGNLDKECVEYCEIALDKIQKSEFVEYKGIVPYDEVFETLKKYKAFLYITIMEGLPLSVLEAASCGLHLILSKIPHHTYLNLPSVTYVDTKFPKIPSINEIISGHSNREYVMNNFSNKKMGVEYLKIYNSFKIKKHD